MTQSSDYLKDKIEEVYLSFLLSYAKFFTGLIGFQMLILTMYVYVFTFHQELLESAAYKWALDKPGAGFGSYGIIAGIALALMCVWLFSGSKTALILGMSLFTWIQMMFGISILVLTLSGSPAAITGTIQWLSIPIINIILLMTSGIPPNNRSN